MSMSITPAELVLYVEFVAAVHDHHRRDHPSEREEKTLHSVARMMLADSTRAIQENSGELETSLTRVKEIVARIEPYSANGSRIGDALMELVVSHGVEGAARLLHEAADALLQNEGFRAAEQAAEAGMASILLPSTIH